MITTDWRRPQRIALELQARARDHVLADRVEELERAVARVHARIDGALVTVVPAARARADAGSSAPG
jgi:hypothetical protein